MKGTFKMEDKKVLAFINKNYEEKHKEFVKNNKKKRKKEIICTLIWFLACISLVYVLGSIINHETLKNVDTCLKNGNTKEYCLRVNQ